MCSLRAACDHHRVQTVVDAIVKRNASRVMVVTAAADDGDFRLALFSLHAKQFADLLERIVRHGRAVARFRLSGGHRVRVVTAPCEAAAAAVRAGHQFAQFFRKRIRLRAKIFHDQPDGQRHQHTDNCQHHYVYHDSKTFAFR